nr:heterodisulfide reductase-related iron-sulfur binding cluster [Thermus scotoductus]
MRLHHVGIAVEDLEEAKARYGLLGFGVVAEGEVAAQGVREAPRRILKASGVEVLEPKEWEICCGSAGTYNLFQPEIAEVLGRRKAENLQATQPELVVTGNIGCLTQIQAYLDKSIPILHTAELLEMLYIGRHPGETDGGGDAL